MQLSSSIYIHDVYSKWNNIFQKTNTIDGYVTSLLEYCATLDVNFLLSNISKCDITSLPSYCVIVDTNLSSVKLYNGNILSKFLLKEFYICSMLLIHFLVGNIPLSSANAFSINIIFTLLYWHNSKVIFSSANTRNVNILLIILHWHNR